ncbi:DNA-3-methyladenine glycosylase family protein [Anaeromicrobium sediminis]|uniref:DNA-3-methyladenine glycosylase II n=1 Tax=Anaeromicrobium sediminis TaxID=1478221 RepID=A0A267MQ93_9FIRM|nr:DNA-3-methyladenine glycosylase [Anaeromicrobium sediminis]PAB61075.1 DNA-3-methyladenine glycosylase [Anaeromicrobium sediminis]
MKDKFKDNCKAFDSFIEIYTPKEFNFKECLVYLNRSDLECTHKVRDKKVYKLIKIEDNKTLVEISHNDGIMKVKFLNHIPNKIIKEKIGLHVWNMFDLSTNLTSFYESVGENFILSKLMDKYYGLRIIKINNLFECLCWAIIGQQINLKFAYTLKKRIVEKYGESVTYENEEYWLFPKVKVIANLKVEHLKELQFTIRKAEYVIDVAKLFLNKEFEKEILKNNLSYNELFKKLISIRGIGSWTADYAIMKSFSINCAFPIKDVGIQNALKNILGLEKKPELEEIELMAENWKDWESYATFYLWRSLYD